MMKRAHAARHFTDFDTARDSLYGRRPNHIKYAGHREACVDQMSRHVPTCIVSPIVLLGTTVGPVTKLHKRPKVGSVAPRRVRSCLVTTEDKQVQQPPFASIR